LWAVASSSANYTYDSAVSLANSWGGDWRLPTKAEFEELYT